MKTKEDDRNESRREAVKRWQKARREERAFKRHHVDYENAVETFLQSQYGVL